jgi:hypothetical protein
MFVLILLLCLVSVQGSGFASEADVVIELNGVEPRLNVFPDFAVLADVFGKTSQSFGIAIRSSLFHVSGPGFDLPRGSRGLGMGLNPSEDFPVALSGAKLLQKGFGIETEKSDKVLVSRRIVVVLAILLGEGCPAFVKHSGQDDEAAQANMKAARRALG